MICMCADEMQMLDFLFCFVFDMRKSFYENTMLCHDAVSNGQCMVSYGRKIHGAINH